MRCCSGLWQAGSASRLTRLLLWALAGSVLVLLLLRVDGGSKDRIAVRALSRHLAALFSVGAPALVRAEAEPASSDASDLSAVAALLRSWPPDKPKACITVLARNSDLAGVVSSIGALERRFNGREEARYPIIYVNDKPFTKEFRRVAAAASSAPSFFGHVPREHWSYPAHVNQTLAAERRAAARRHMPYGGSESYRFMCRYFSGFFFDHPLLAGFDWYWRVEPDVYFTCDLEEDPFRAMAAANQVLAWTIVMAEVPSTIPTLWPTAQAWLAANPQHIAPDTLLPAFLEEGLDPQDDDAEAEERQQRQVAALQQGPPFPSLPTGERGARRTGNVESARRLVSDSGSMTVHKGGSSGSLTAHGSSGGGSVQPPAWLLRGRYTGCHMWSNFEIGRLAFFRSPAYRALFSHLDAAGGFFYERWGDAPVHTLAAAALLRRSEVRWARDIGYAHGSWAHCPLEPSARQRCDCNPHWDWPVGAQPQCQLDFLTRLAALERSSAEQAIPVLEAEPRLQHD